MLSLAIGREGQNVRLAARLTGWRIDIRSDVSVAEAKAATEAEAEAAKAPEAAAEAPAAGSCGAPPPRRRRRARRCAPAKPKRATKKASAAAETNGTQADAAEPGQGEADDQEDGRSCRGQRDGGRRCEPAKAKRATKAKKADVVADAHGTDPAAGELAAEESAPQPPRRWRRSPGDTDRRGGSRRRADADVRRVSDSASQARAPAYRQDPSGEIVFDPTGRLAGRGAYVCHDTDCLTKAIDKGARAGRSRPRSRRRSSRTSSWEPSPRTPSKEEPVARSRSGTRGRRGPRKPPRRTDHLHPRSRSSIPASAGRSSYPGPSRSRSSSTCYRSTSRTSSAS